MNNFNRSVKQRQQRIEKYTQSADQCRFFDLLTGPKLLNVLEMHLPEHRERHYPPALTLSMFLGQVLSADGSCQNAVNEHNVHRVLLGLSPLSGGTGGYCSARQRLPLDLVQALAQECGSELDAHAPADWLWKGRHVKLVDGTTVTLSDTEDNQAHYPQHGNQADGVGFPLARLVGVISLATGAVLSVAMGAYRGKGTGEHGLFRELRETFTNGDLMLADSYYCSYFLIADMQARSVDVVFEQHGARRTDFRRGRKLGPRDHLVKWPKPPRPSWMGLEEYRRYPDTVSVREMKVRGKILVSTLSNPSEVPKNELGELFVQRWSVELDLRNIKTTLGMEVLKCKTASMCEKELWVYLMAYNVIRLLMAEAAYQAGVQPRRLSFKHTLQLWTAWSQRRALASGQQDMETLFTLIAQKRVGKRPDRVEPRAVKRRPKPFPRLKVSREEARRKIKKGKRGKRACA